jgi:hypothetical protein
MKKILIELRTAINIGNDILRKKDYIEGLNKFFKYQNTIKDCDVVFVDNTHEDESQLPNEIMNEIPEGVFLYVKNKNDYGKYNKGAGDIELWKEYSDTLLNYDYFFHYEPRMIINDFSFIESFISNPRNYFCKESSGCSVKTGYFGVNVKDFYEFYSQVDLDNMVNNKISIENIMYDFFKEKNVDFIENKSYCTRRWYMENSTGYGYEQY